MDEPKPMTVAQASSMPRDSLIAFLTNAMHEKKADGSAAFDPGHRMQAASLLFSLLQPK